MNKPAVFSIMTVLLIVSCMISAKTSRAQSINLQFRFVCDSACSSYEKFILRNTGKEYLLSENIEIDQDDVEYARAERDEYGSNSIFIQLDKNGAEKLSVLTAEENHNRKVGIINDSDLVTVAVIKVHVTNGKAMIKGNFTVEDVRDIVKRINGE